MSVEDSYIRKLIEKMVYLTTKNKITYTQENEIINFVVDIVENKIKNSQNFFHQEEKLDPDIYAQNVEEIFNKNISNINSFDTAIISLGDIVFEWVKDSIVYSDQNTLVNNTWATYSVYDFGFVRQGLINSVDCQIKCNTFL
ncbi:hypothetical protein ACPTKN_13905 [Enterococcus faecalis]|uniref:hypothetical protein n=1 Tax=Enterococcus faecalis TaxID=1351 RepID=UPI003CC5DFEC